MQKKKNMARIISIILVVALVATLVMSILPLQTSVQLDEINNATSTSNQEKVTETTKEVEISTEDTTESKTVSAEELEELKTEKKFATIKLTTGEQIKLALYPKIAPISVENFIKLANEHFYDGIIFHRVIADFMIQTGDPTGTGTGGSENKIKGEFKSNGVENPLSHKKGILSMARATDKDSASSQFFITVADSTYLDGEYAAFGEVIEGQDVADKISLVETDNMDKPLEEIKIETITIEE